jgi:hypothetical protein
LAYQANWIRQRHAFLVEQEDSIAAFPRAEQGSVITQTGDAPFPIRLLGESGGASLRLYLAVRRFKTPEVPKLIAGLAEDATRLFPEAKAVVVSLYCKSDNSMMHITTPDDPPGPPAAMRPSGAP